MSAEFQPRSPDYSVNAFDKHTEVKGPIGVAWSQPDGSIRIKLNPFLLLDTSRQDLVISLFKIDSGSRRKKTQSAPPEDEATPVPF